MQGSVLIVDDDPLVSGSLHDMILEIGDMRAETVSNPLDGLHKLHNGGFDLVFSDIMMPGMSGIEFLREVKHINPWLPVVIITGFPTIDLAVQAMKEGAAEFIKKPFSFQVIKCLLQQLLGERRRIGEASGDCAPAAGLPTVRDISKTLSAKAREVSLLHEMNESFYTTHDAADLNEVYRLIVDTACNIAGCTHAVLFVFDRESSMFNPVCAEKISIEACEPLPTPQVHSALYGRDYARIDMQQGGVVVQEVPFNHRPRTTGIMLPIVIQQQLYGILRVERKEFWRPFKDDEILLLKNLSRKAALAIENKLLSQSVYENIQSTLNTLVAVIGARDHYTLSHSMRVTEYALQIGQARGCCKEELDILNFAGHLHDIGKIGISDVILLKPGRLTDQEQQQIRQHPVIGEHILKPLGYLPRERDVIRYHHERWDGSGYPDGLQGNDIPLLSRILTVADAFDAMTTDRPYRGAMPYRAAISEMLQENSQFDTEIVSLFAEIIKRQEPVLTAQRLVQRK